MLPMTLQFLIGMVASAFKELARRECLYLEEEVRVLGEQVRALAQGE